MAESFSWEVGTVVRIGGTVCEVREVKGNEVCLRNWETNEIKITELDKLRKLVGGIDVFVVNPEDKDEKVVDLLARHDKERKFLSALPTDSRSKASMRDTLIRVRWVNALRQWREKQDRPLPQARDISDLVIAFLAKKFGLPVYGAATLRRWEKAGEEDATRLICKYNLRGGAGQNRTDAASEELLISTIERVREGKLKLSPSSIHEDMKESAKALQKDGAASAIAVPSISTIGRRLNQHISPYERVALKAGKKIANKAFRATVGRPVVTHPGLVTEFDDLDTKLFCVNRALGLPWGRPWITAGVDQSSYYPAGLSLDNKPRSGWSAVSALVNSIEAKDMAAVNEAYAKQEGRYEWHAYGYPTQVVFDNALYNNQRIVSLSADAGDASWARPYTPTDKRAVEYFWKRMLEDFLSELPGWRGDKADPDSIKNGMCAAVLDVDELKMRLLRWMLGRHVKRPMESGWTSEQLYLEQHQAISFRVKQPPDVHRLRLLKTLTFTDTVTWTRNGIKMLGLLYQDADLFSTFVNRAGGRMKVNIRVDPTDLEFIYVHVPGTDIVLMVECIYQDYARGINLYQHQMVRKFCSEKKIRNPSIFELTQGRAEFCVTVAQWEKSGQLRHRKVAERAEGLKPVAGTQVSVVTELESQCDELDQVELATENEEWAMPAPF